MSFQQIEKQCPKAADMLSLMAVLDRQAISRGLLSVLDCNGIDHKAAIAKLKSFSLIHEEDSSAKYTIHRLVQISTQGWLSDHGKLSRWQATALHAVAQQYPRYVTFEDWPLVQDLSSHVQVVLAYSINESQALLNRAQILHCFGHYTLEQGRMNLAVLMLEESHALRKKHLGEEAEPTLESLGLLGLTHSRLNQLQLACKILAQFYEASEHALGPRHPLTLKGMSRLAVIHEKQGHVREGRDLLLRALSLTEETFGPTSEEAILLLTKLAYCCNRLGQWKDAEDVALKAVKLRIEHKGEDHPDTVTLMGSLAWTFRAQCRYREAEQLVSKALRRRLEVLGVDHPKTRQSMTTLAELLGLLERWQDAEQLQKHVVEARQRIEGSQQWATRRAQTYLDMLQQVLNNPKYGLKVKTYLEYNYSKESGAKMVKPSQRLRKRHNHSNSADAVSNSQELTKHDYTELRDKRLALRDIELQLANLNTTTKQSNGNSADITVSTPTQTANNESIHQLRERLAEAQANYRLAAKNLGIASAQLSTPEGGRVARDRATSELSRSELGVENQSAQIPEGPRGSIRRDSVDSMATLVEPESSLMPGW